MAEFGPLAPVRIETQPEARLTIAAGMKNGLIRRGPPFSSVVVLALDGREAADAAADVDARPARRRRGVDREPAVLERESAAATANWMKRSIFLTSFFSTKRSGSKPFTSQAKWVECCEASKSVMGAAPERPARRPCPGLLGADARAGTRARPR